MAIRRLSTGRGYQPRTVNLAPEDYQVYGDPAPYPLTPSQQAAAATVSGPQFRAGGSPRDLAENDRIMGQYRGDILMQQARDTEGIYGGLEDYYSGAALGAYEPLVAGYGGYGPEGEAAIAREGELQALQQYDPNELYMTGAEEAQYMGDPYSGLRYYDPRYTTSLQMGAEGAQRDLYRQLGRDLTGAASAEGLGVSDDYARSLEGALGGTETAVRGALDPTALRQSGDFVSRYRMTPEQQQDIITRAGISAGRGYQTAAGDLARSAEAAGTSPMGQAAARARLERMAAADAGDAMTEARVLANREAAGRELDIERGRLGAEQYLAAQRAANEQALGARRAGYAQTGEEMRLGAARDISNRAMEAARVGGQTALAAEQDIGRGQQDVARWNQQTGMAAQAGAEAEAARRQQALLDYRKNMQRYNQEQRYGRGMDINQALSNRYQNIYGARRGEAAEGRGFLTGQAARYGGYGENARNRQLDIYGTQGQLVQGGTRSRLAADQAPRWWERAIGAGATALGAATGAGAFSGFGGRAKPGTTDLSGYFKRITG